MIEMEKSLVVSWIKDMKTYELSKDELLFIESLSNELEKGTFLLSQHPLMDQELDDEKATEWAMAYINNFFESLPEDEELGDEANPERFVEEFTIEIESGSFDYLLEATECDLCEKDRRNVQAVEEDGNVKYVCRYGCDDPRSASWMGEAQYE